MRPLNFPAIIHLPLFATPVELPSKNNLALARQLSQKQMFVVPCSVAIKINNASQNGRWNSFVVPSGFTCFQDDGSDASRLGSICFRFDAQLLPARNAIASSVRSVWKSTCFQISVSLPLDVAGPASMWSRDSCGIEFRVFNEPH